MTAPTSHCRRALQRQIAPCRDAVWITDGLLASAFERYCRVSKTWNRKASNVPGPLEGQRRLGRRRMGDASTWYCPPTPPSWAFLTPPDLSRWTWKPPSSSQEQTGLREDHNTPAEFLSLLPRWLRDSVHQEAGMDQTSAASADASPSPATMTPADPYAALMDGFRWAATHADDDAFASHANKMCSRLRQRIILGQTSPNDILLLASEVWSTLESRLQGSQRGQRLSLSLCRTILSGLTTSKVLPPSLMDSRFWDTLLRQMSKLPHDDALCNLFVKVMRAMPMDHRSLVSEGILSVLTCFFCAWNRSSSTPEGREIRRLLDIGILGELYEKQQKLSALPASLRQARAISEVLYCGTPEETKGLVSAVHRLVFNETAASAEGGRMLRYSWLYVLANMPHVNEDFLFDAAASLSEPALMPPLSVVEVSSLLLTQWASRGYLRSPTDVYRSYRRHLGRRDDAALSSLFLALFSRGNNETRKGLYRSAWKFLGKLNRTDYVIRSLAFDSQTGKLPVRMLEDLACTSDDHYTAIRLHDLWSRHIRTKDQPQWYPGVFDKYAEAIVRDPRIPAKTIWRVLDIGKLESQQSTLGNKMRRHRGAFGQRRAAVVEKMSKAFMDAPHLSNRAAVRHVSRSFAFLKAVRGKVPDFILQDLYRLVTRDLWEEKPGRTQRLLWFLRILERRHGLEFAWSCRLALRRWRARLTKIWLSKGNGWQG
ncbi:hypothetical protein N657DRAFT_652354 [Parathielavia appendiculata]|uniref:Uncharacterized protein n=1 Tax=Parathielavia appendiculata TaxID=2587402 RepID=A0AAN6Z8D8_9PEZI|nr:hypothetical protein N657DRAFT_652354 [Parathielavia appendiculata]